MLAFRTFMIPVLVLVVLSRAAAAAQDSEWADAFKKAADQPWANPVMPVDKDPRKEPDLKAFLDEREMALMTPPYFPGWVISCGKPGLTLFHRLPQVWRVGGPTRLAFSAAGKTEVFQSGAEIPAEKLAAMDKPWMLVWFTGARGWEKFDMPMLVVLQHKPAAVEFKDDLRLTFQEKAGVVTVANLYGYYKPPQDNRESRRWADARGKDKPADGPFGMKLGPTAPLNVRPYEWKDALPAGVVERCDYFAGLSRAVPVFLRDTFQVDLKENVLRVRCAFSYLTTSDDWGTKARTVAPVSPTFALCARYGLPVKFDGEVFDPVFPTTLGPWCVIPDRDRYEVSLGVLQYLSETYLMELNERSDDPLVKKAIEALTVTAPKMCLNTEPWGSKDKTYEKRDMKLDVGSGKTGHYGSIWVFLTSDRTKGYAMRYVKPEDRAKAQENMRNYFEYTCFTEEGYEPEQIGGKTFLTRNNEPSMYGGYQGDSGKLIMDALLPAWLYSYHGKDYAWIGPKVEVLEKLTPLLAMMGWAQAGRLCIAEMGGEAPPAMSFARLMYAARDQSRFAWGAYVTAMEMLQVHLKCGPMGEYARKFQPWHRFEKMDDTENATDCWGSGHGWQIGGPGRARIKPRLSKAYDVSGAQAFGSAQWVARWGCGGCAHDLDFTCFLRENCLDTPGGLRFEFETEMKRNFADLIEGPVRAKEYMWDHVRPAGQSYMQNNPAHLLMKYRHLLGESVEQVTKRLNGWELPWNDVFKASWCWEPDPWLPWALADNPKFERIMKAEALPWTPGLGSVYKADSVRLLYDDPYSRKDPVSGDVLPPFPYIGFWAPPASPKGSLWGLGFITAEPSRKIASMRRAGNVVNIAWAEMPVDPDPLDLPLEGKNWKFSADNPATGIRDGWFKPELDDTKWTNIEVPGNWEDQPALPEKVLPASCNIPPEIVTSTPPGNAPTGGWYDGTAWYRIKVKVPAEFKDREVFFHAGAIDDFDIVWVNGVKIGQTDYKTNPKDFWCVTRMYRIPPEALKFGEENVVAVMVCDNNCGGGIAQGPVRLIAREKPAGK
jgi:hypothetical protein